MNKCIGFLCKQAKHLKLSSFDAYIELKGEAFDN